MSQRSAAGTSEKDRVINMLRHELDLEQLDKADLQCKLSVQKLMNKKLCQQLCDKIKEITKLESSAADLENKSSQLRQGFQSREPKLKKEIFSLQKYVLQLQMELGEIRNEAGSIKKNLTEAAEECTTWYNKALTAEKELHNFQEKHQEQEQELQKKRSQCNDLKKLLEELRTAKRANDSSLETDINLFESSPRAVGAGSSCENLASTVVDMQLRDVLKENNELRNLLKDNEESAIKANEELDTLKFKIAKLQIDSEILKSDNNNLLEKISVFTETRASLQNVRQELEKSEEQLSEISQQNTFLQLNIADLQNQIASTKITPTETGSSNQSISKDLATLQTKEVTINLKIESGNAQYKHQLEETVETLALERSECKENDDLLSKTNQDLSITKLDLEPKKEKEADNSELKISCQGIKNTHSLKLTHLPFVRENYEKFSKLQSELSQQILLFKENAKLKNTIKHLQENVTVLLTEQTVINAKKQKEEVIRKLETCRPRIHNVLEGKSVIQEEIAVEKKQLKECKAVLQENKTIPMPSFKKAQQLFHNEDDIQKCLGKTIPKKNIDFGRVNKAYVDENNENDVEVIEALSISSDDSDAGIKEKTAIDLLKLNPLKGKTILLERQTQITDSLCRNIIEESNVISNVSTCQSSRPTDGSEINRKTDKPKGSKTRIAYGLNINNIISASRNRVAKIKRILPENPSN